MSNLLDCKRVQPLGFWFLCVHPIFIYSLYISKACFIILTWFWWTELLACSVLYDWTNSWHRLSFLILILKGWSILIIFNCFSHFFQQFAMLTNFHLSWKPSKWHSLFSMNSLLWFIWESEVIVLQCCKQTSYTGFSSALQTWDSLLNLQLESSMSQSPVQGAQRNVLLLWWLMPVIPATQEVAVGRIMVGGWPWWKS
jgi:hypothetical protein